MISNVTSGVQQTHSVVHILVSILFKILFPFRLLQSIKQNSLHYIDCWSSILNIAVCTWRSKSQPNPLQYTCLGNPWAEGPGGRQSVESQRIRRDLETKQRQRVYRTLYFILQKVFWSCGCTGGDSGEQSCPSHQGCVKCLRNRHKYSALVIHKQLRKDLPVYPPFNHLFHSNPFRFWSFYHSGTW